MGKIVTVCSGSGGCGKSTVALSLAVGAAKRGKRTILLDASGAARACDLMLGLESIVVLDMLDVIKQQSSLQAALYDVPERKNLQFACASLYEGAYIAELSGVLLALRAMCDMLVIDMATGPVGIGEGVLDDEDAIVMITRPDDASIRALERILGSIGANCAQRVLAVNHCNGAWMRKGIQYDRQRVQMLLDMPVSCCIPEDERIVLGMKKGKAALECDSRIASEFVSLLEAVL